MTMQIHPDIACGSIKALAGFGIAYLRDDLSCHFLIVQLCVRCDLAEDVELVSGTGNFTGNSGFRVLGKEFIEYAVSDLIAQLVRMSSCDGF